MVSDSHVLIIMSECVMVSDSHVLIIMSECVLCFLIHMY